MDKDEVNELVDLDLLEVSFVDVPANKSARVAFYKRENDMDEDKIKVLEGQVETLKAENTTLTEQVTALKKSLEEVTVVEKAEDTIEIDGEKIAKSAVPASVLKKLEALQVDAEKADITKRIADTIPNVKGTADQKAKLLKSIGNDEDLLSILRAADKLFAKGFEEIGGSDGEGDLTEPNEKLNALAKKYSEENKTTFEQAYAAVIKTAAGKKLITEIYKK